MNDPAAYPLGTRSRVPRLRSRLRRPAKLWAALAMAALACMAITDVGVGVGAASAAKLAPPKACNTRGAVKCYGTKNFPVTNYLKYVGGKAGRANPKLSPIDIGWLNQQGGSSDIAPETTIGAKDAVRWLNGHARGIDGHPVKLVTCYIPDAVANATQCGQMFANDKSVSAVAMGAVAIGNQSFESALAPTKKVIVFLISLADVDDSYRPGFALYGDSTHILAPYATFASKYLHLKRVSVLYQNVPGSVLGADIIAKALRHVHIKATIFGFPATESDLTSALVAAKVPQSQMVISTVGGTDCSDLYLAMKALKLTKRVKVGVFGPCASAQVEAADGGAFPPGWYYASANAVFQDPADPSGPAFYKVLKPYGDESYAPDPWVTDGFGQILTIAKWDTELGGKNLTPSRIASVARKFHGPVPFGAEHLVCGQYKNAPAVCNDKSTLYLDNNGVFHAVVRWVGPPKGFVPPAG